VSRARAAHRGGARVSEIPEAFALVANGELHISALRSLKVHVNRENATELFALCRNKSARRVEELLAARFQRRTYAIRFVACRCSALYSTNILPWAVGGKPTAENLRSVVPLTTNTRRGSTSVRAACGRRPVSAAVRGQPEARADDPRDELC